MPEQNERMKLKALCNKEEDKGLKCVHVHLQVVIFQNRLQHNLCVVYFGEVKLCCDDNEQKALRHKERG